MVRVDPVAHVRSHPDWRISGCLPKKLDANYQVAGQPYAVKRYIADKLRRTNDPP